MHVRVWAEDGSENVRLGGGFHMCDQSKCEKEVLSFIGRVFVVR